MGVITKTTQKNDLNMWSFATSILFTGLFALAIYILNANDRMPESISFFNTVLIVLAVFRLTRLFVYDNVTRFLRDMFIIKEERRNEDGETVVVRRKYENGFLRSMSDLLSCPWCIGMWLSLFVSFLFFVSPEAWFIIFVLAIAGFSSLIQISINLVGWRAEQLKTLVEIDTESEQGTDF